MDRVRFGRALGFGAREAAKSLMKAADAATSPNPAAVKNLGQVAARTTTRVRTASAGVKRGGKRFGEAVWGPVLKLSGVLWLEVTGVFFGLFALTAGVEVWKHRMDLHSAGTPRQHLILIAAMCLLFTWFTVTSFLKAARRSRG